MPPEGEDTQTGRTGRQTMSKDTGKSICEKRIFLQKQIPRVCGPPARLNVQGKRQVQKQAVRSKTKKLGQLCQKLPPQKPLGNGIQAGSRKNPSYRSARLLNQIGRIHHPLCRRNHDTW
jgi:hypothetical protein